MLKFDLDKHQFESLKPTELKEENLLEHYDLQRAIINSWGLFRNEIGLPSSYIIGHEIKPHSSTQDAIDILVYNPDDSSLIIIELKRGKNKLQLLQALTYAAMVSQWDSEELVSKIQRGHNPEPDELIDLIRSNELNSDVKTILISENFDPEVVITADWLNGNYSVDITAFAISLHKLEESTFLSVEQRYPLKELTDVYEERGRKKSRRKKREDIEWEDVLPKLKYPFAERGIQLCRRIREGDPSRRRFGYIRQDHDGFTWISLNFREKYINVYIKGDFEGAQELIQSKFEDEITISDWRYGLSFLVETETQFEDLVQWLRLG